MFSSSPQYQKNQKNFRKTDIFVASYPRSGNTWIRLLLSDVILQLHGFNTATGGNIIPDVYKVDIQTWDQDHRIKIPIRFIKTHEPYITSYNRAIYLFRHPADCLCSYYHYMLRYQNFREQNPEVNRFCFEHLGEWCNHVQSYIEAKAEKHENIILMSYENLHTYPDKNLQFIMNLLGFNCTHSICKKAVEHQSFKNVQDLAKQENPEKMGFFEDEGYKNFFRKGKVNNYLEELSLETIKLINDKALPIYKKAKSLEPVVEFDLSGIFLTQEVTEIPQESCDPTEKYISYFKTAKELQRKGKPLEAVIAYRKALEINPNSAWSYHNLGEALAQLEHWDEATFAYKKAIELNPKSASYYYKLACILDKLSDHQAICYYSKAAESKPNSSLFQRKLRESLGKKNEYNS
ncbi:MULTISPECIES: sulfotransferase domain-containing protein [unclassified Microcoleus]|uniref:sulfotransferase domain-containing protein n=1 Tax=unclassified Microcoleus TaxID=2642155 RepID=UPI002FD76BC3